MSRSPAPAPPPSAANLFTPHPKAPRTTPTLFSYPCLPCLCTRFADTDADGEPGGQEPATITDDFGGWTLVYEEDSAALDAPVVLLPDGEFCIDRYTDMPLLGPALAAPTYACPLLSLLSTTTTLLAEQLQGGGLSEAEAAQEATTVRPFALTPC